MANQPTCLFRWQQGAHKPRGTTKSRWWRSQNVTPRQELKGIATRSLWNGSQGVTPGVELEGMTTCESPCSVGVNSGEPRRSTYLIPTRTTDSGGPASFFSLDAQSSSCTDSRKWDNLYCCNADPSLLVRRFPVGFVLCPFAICLLSCRRVGCMRVTSDTTCIPIQLQ